MPKDEHDGGLLSHLTELRKRLIHSFFFFLLSFLLVVIFSLNTFMVF